MSENLAWVAGIFDGEGCVGIYRLKSQKMQHFLRVEVQMAHRPTIERIQRIMGGVLYDKKVRIDKPEHYRQMYHWQLDGQSAESFLRSIRPFSTTKVEQIDIALEALTAWGFMRPVDKRNGLSPQVTQRRESYRLALQEAKK